MQDDIVLDLLKELGKFDKFMVRFAVADEKVRTKVFQILAGVESAVIGCLWNDPAYQGFNERIQRAICEVQKALWDQIQGQLVRDGAEDHVSATAPKTDWASVLGLTWPPADDLAKWGFRYARSSDPFASQRLCDTRAATDTSLLFDIEDMKDIRKPATLARADGIAQAVAEFVASESDPSQLAFKATVHGAMTVAAVRKFYSKDLNAYRKALHAEITKQLGTPVSLTDVDEGIRMARAVLCD